MAVLDVDPGKQAVSEMLIGPVKPSHDKKKM